MNNMSKSSLTLASPPTARQQRPHLGQQEVVRLPLEGLSARAEAVQGAVHAGRARAHSHRRQAQQVLGKYPVLYPWGLHLALEISAGLLGFI